MSCDYELANEWARCSGKTQSVYACMYIYIWPNSEKKNTSYKTSQTGKFRNRSRWLTRYFMLLHAKALCPSTVTMCSPRETLAAGLFILVFSQEISSTAGNFFNADFKTTFGSYLFVVVISYIMSDSVYGLSEEGYFL